jgi:hypothetical protein
LDGTVGMVAAGGMAIPNKSGDLGYFMPLLA